MRRPWPAKGRSATENKQTALKGIKKKIEMFSKQLFGWCKDRKNENLRFAGRRIVAWSIPSPPQFLLA
jgi:hypothetical protein